MELKEFIAATLIEVIEGVKEAQDFAQKNGAFINPNMNYKNGSNSPNTLFTYEDGDNKYIAQIFEFDIAITTSTKDTEKGGIGVAAAILNVGVSGENQDTNSEVSRIKFSIPVMLPIQVSKYQTSENSLTIGKNPLSDYRG